MQDQLNALKLGFEQEMAKAKTADDVAQVETRYLGRKGLLADLMKQLPSLAAEERPKMGILANDIKRQLEMMLASRRRQLDEEKMSNLAESERVDVTEPGTRPPEGHLHPMTKAINEITDIFERIGFVRTRYPEVDWDWYAFESLNMPKDHPARDEWETFFMDAPVSKKGKMVLTPHTTNSQVRELEKGDLPIRMIDISKCYRRQSDATHVPMFHQFEGLYVDKGVSISHLRGVLDYFAREFFGPERKTRLRPFHFRFTEPSFEIDVTCGVCGGTGITPLGPPLARGEAGGSKCRMCKRGWLELGGAGMVHPNVLKAGGVDPKKYSGFAFGWGVERTYSMKGGLKLDDIRILYKNDLRFLEQF